MKTDGERQVRKGKRKGEEEGKRREARKKKKRGMENKRDWKEMRR